MEGCEVVEPNEIKKEKREDLQIAVSEISEFCKGGVTFVVNDDTRPTPTAKLLENLGKEVEKSRFIIATGNHSPPFKMEYIFGKAYKIKKITVHSSHDNSSYVGKTRFGNSIYLDNQFLKAERVVVISSTEPHYFAGYTGGRKSLLPGLAGYETIERNHELALKENAKPLNLTGNPVNDEMEDCLELMVREKELLGVNCVLDKDHNIFSIKTGDMKKTFKEAVVDAKKIFAVKIKEKADIVITRATPPLDATLYQAQKAIDHGKLALKEGGVIILLADCKRIGDRTFYDLLSKNEPRVVIQKVNENYKLGYHKAARLAALLLESKIFAVTRLDDHALKKIGITPFHTLDEACKEAKEMGGGKILYLKDGSLTVPV